MAEPARDAAASDDWNWAERAAAWRRWHPTLTEWWRGVTDLLIDWTEPAPGMRVLDLASGTGEPALTLAPLVAPGDVTATDIVPEMVALRRRTRRRGTSPIFIPYRRMPGRSPSRMHVRPCHLPLRGDVFPRCAAGAPRGAARTQTGRACRLRHLGAAGAD